MREGRSLASLLLLSCLLALLTTRVPVEGVLASPRSKPMRTGNPTAEDRDRDALDQVVASEKAGRFLSEDARTAVVAANVVGNRSGCVLTSLVIAACVMNPESINQWKLDQNVIDAVMVGEDGRHLSGNARTAARAGNVVGSRSGCV